MPENIREVAHQIRKEAQAGLRSFMNSHPGYSYFDPIIDHLNTVMRLSEGLVTNAVCPRKGNHVDGCCYVHEED